MKTLKTGSEALLVYPTDGDVDRVRILELDRSGAVVRVIGGARNVLTVEIEDIGIGVDDEITAVFDDGTTFPKTCTGCGLPLDAAHALID